MKYNVKVWNDNIYDFEQKMRDVLIKIPAGKYVEMDYWDAESFIGKYYPPKYDGMGNPKPESFKKLRIEGLPPHLVDEGKSLKSEEFTCMACGDRLTSKEALEEHTDKYHLDILDDQKLAEKRRKGAAK